MSCLLSETSNKKVQDCRNDTLRKQTELKAFEYRELREVAVCGPEFMKWADKCIGLLGYVTRNVVVWPPTVARLMK